jgi:dolichol kinase
MVKGEMLKEFGRKAFHQLSLVYLAAFWYFGWPRTGWLMAVWLPAVFVVETARLKVPAVERFLLGVMGGLMRESERRHYSGIIFTTAGSLAAMLIARGDPVIVGAAILQLALGDSASALAGKAFGRVKLFGGKKSLEGSLAGFAVGFAAALVCGVRPGAAFLAALAGSLAELLPTTPWFNDNLWIPVASATVLRIVGAR